MCTFFERAVHIVLALWTCSVVATVAHAETDPNAEVLDEVVVRSAAGTAADLPSTLSTEVIDWRDETGAPQDIQDMLVRVPGVGATGQSGLFETFSIRGSSGNGVLVLLDGIPITAQRRAGVTISFVEPALLGAVNVTRGPATVHFGPGAMGGAVSIEPNWFRGSELLGSYASSGEENLLMAGYGNKHLSLGIARHHAGDSKSADGTPLNTSYERESASLQFKGDISDWQLETLMLPSRTKNIGKSNVRFPTRNTTYPEDKHDIGSLRLRHSSGFETRLSAHDQSLLTYNQRPDSADTWSYIESKDWGLTAQHRWQSHSVNYNIGVEHLARRDVNGFDARGTLNARTYSLLNARESMWSLFGIAEWQPISALSIEAGARTSYISQSQRGANPSDEDSALSLGLIWTPEVNHRATLTLASGFRFASLEERFFSGVTPRGEIIGNANLGSEHSLGLDLGYAVRFGSWKAQANVWRSRVEDLIQLAALTDDINGYTNVGKASLHGFELGLGWEASQNLDLQASYAVVRSKDDATGEPLYGAPPPTLTLGANYLGKGFRVGLLYQHRAALRNPGFEEVERPSVNLIDLDLFVSIDAKWSAQFFIRNALNNNYYASADVLSALAPERSLGVSIYWIP